MQDLASSIHPEEWESQNKDLDLRLLKMAFYRMVKSCSITLPQKYIVKIERIQNIWLWEEYYQHHDRMERKTHGELMKIIYFMELE